MIFLFSFLIIITQSINGHGEEPDDSLRELKVEVAEYIKPWQGKITVHYQNLMNDVSYTLHSKKKVPAASTIKLPLALYVMKLAEQGEIDIKEKLTYKSHHYYEGSGIIQNDQIGTSYSIEDLVEKAMIYSDNIAFIMLKERVGQNHFIHFMKGLGAQYTYPGGQNVTSAGDLILYAKEAYRFARESGYGAKLVKYLEHTIYNTTIPQGIPEKNIAHKVGMIPKDLIYNDVAIVFDTEPFALAVTTMDIGYEKSQEVIAGIAAIVDRHHELMVKEALTVEIPESKLESIYTKENTKSDSYSAALTREFFKNFIKPWSKSLIEESEASFYQKLFSLNHYLYADLNEINKSWEAAEKKAEADLLRKSIRITFAGDAMMDWSVKETVKQKGPEYPFVHIKEELSSSDLSVVNLETAITTEGEKVPKEYNFRSDPISLTGLKNAGFQLVSLANNHSFDYGQSGFTDTLKNLKKYELDYIGGGMNKQEAYAAKTYNIKGRRIKVLAFSRVLPDFSW